MEDLQEETTLRSNRLVLTASKAANPPDIGLIFSPDLSAEDISKKSRRLAATCPDAFLRLIRYSPNAISILDSEGHLQAVNKGFIDLFGEIPEGEYNFFKDPVLLELGFEELFHRLIQGETVSTPFKIWYDCTKSFAKNSDRKIYLAGTAIPIFNDKGGLDNIVVICTDSTESKIAEAKIRSLDEKILQERNMFVGGPAVVIRWKNEPGWPIEYVSPNIKEVLGYSAEDFISGKLIYADLLHESDLRRVSEELKHFTSTGASNFEHKPYQVMHKNGKPIWVSDYTTIIRDQKGELTHYLGYIIDISELINKGKALHESEQKYRDLVEQAGIAIMMVNFDGHIFYNNETLAGLFGYTMEELKNKPLLDLVHPDDHEKFLKMRACRKKEPQSKFQYEFRGIRKDGSEIYISVNGTTLSNNGKTIGCRSYLTDITKRKKAEFALKEYNTSLEFQVRKRTRQLNESVQNLEREREALLQKNIALEEVLNQIEDVKQRMAHQIQTNLSKQVIPILDILERKISDECAGDIKLLRTCLNEAASPFVSAMDLRFPLLTPREIGICNMIKNGLSSKEIAEVLNISPQTVFKQRKIIRKKLGISGKNFNLEAYIKLIR